MSLDQDIADDLKAAEDSKRGDIIISFHNRERQMTGRVVVEGHRFSLSVPSDPTAGDKREFKTRLHVKDVFCVTIPSDPPKVNKGYGRGDT